MRASTAVLLPHKLCQCHCALLAATATATATATVQRIFIRHKFCDLAKCAPRTWPGNLWLAKQAEGKQGGSSKHAKNCIGIKLHSCREREKQQRRGRGGKGWGRQLTKSGKAKEQQEKAQTRRRDCDKLILQCVYPPYVLTPPPPYPVLVFLCLPPLTPPSLPLSADFLCAFNGTFCQ